MLKIIVGTADKDEMPEWCFEFNRKDRSAKIALAECVAQYLYRHANNPTKIDAMILATVIQCFEDDYWLVRRTACNCLAKLLLVIRYKDRVERKLYEGAIDPFHYVRDHLLRLRKNGRIANSSISERITGIMKSDANDAVRIFANRQ